MGNKLIAVCGDANDSMKKIIVKILKGNTSTELQLNEAEKLIEKLNDLISNLGKKTLNQ